MKAQHNLQHIGSPSTGSRLLKAFMLLTVGLAFVTAAFARTSSLQISLWNHGDFELEICGQRYYADCDLTIPNLAPGSQHFRVIQRNRNGCGNGGRVRVLYDGCVNIPRNARVIACVRPHQQLRVVDVIRYNRPNNNCGRPNVRPHRGNRPNGGFQQYDDWSQNGSGGQGGQGTIAFGGGMDLPDMYGDDRLTNGELNRLLTDLDQAGFEQERVTIAKQALYNQTATSQQVRRILEVFWFENTKVDFAKFAYTQVSDPQNYWVVNDAFDFQNSVHELDNFIQMHG